MNATIRRGDDVRIDVVVRTRSVGHFFPGGTVDAYDTWLELKATDDKGQVIFWSGKIEDDGKGPVEKGAHFYRSLRSMPTAILSISAMPGPLAPWFMSG